MDPSAGDCRCADRSEKGEWAHAVPGERTTVIEADRRTDTIRARFLLMASMVPQDAERAVRRLAAWRWSGTVSSMSFLRSLARTAASTAAALAALVVVAHPAHAHVGLDRMLPASGTVSQDEIKQIELTFSSDITNVRLEVNLFHRDGRPVPFTGEGLSREGNRAVAQLPALEFGTYVLTWSSIGTDGHLAAGQEHFSYGFEEAGAIADFMAVSGGSRAETASRWVFYATIALLIGLVWLRREGLVADQDGAARIARWAGGTAALVSISRLAVIGSRVGGEEGVGVGVLQVLTTWPAGAGWALMFAGVAVLAGRQRGIIAGLALVAVAWGDGLAGHLGADLRSGVLVPLIAVHLLGAGLWLGAPAAQLVAGDRGRTRLFARRFTLWAASSFLAVAASGIALAIMRTGVFTERDVGQLAVYPYGATLLAKTFAVAIVVLPLGGYQAALSIVEKMREMRERFYDSKEAVTREDAPAPEGRRGSLLMQVEVAGLIAVLAAGALLGTLPATPPQSTSLAGSRDLLAVPASYEECASGSEMDRLICANNWFLSVARSQGVPASLQDLTERWNEGDGWMQLNCHSIAHVIGRYAYGSIGDTRSAFEQGSDPCDYGYLHGVIEGAAANMSDQELKESFLTICEGTGDFLNHSYRQCVHGLGHAAARRTNNDLPRAVEFCDAFWREGLDPSRLSVTGITNEGQADAYVFNLCVTGVSMEWNLTPQARASAALPFGSEGTLVYECLQVDERFQPGCLEYGTGALGLSGNFLEQNIAALRWCEDNLADPIACYMSVGRGLVWAPGVTDEQVIEACTGGLGGEYEKACITWALGSVATIALDAEAIDDFCPVVPDRHKHICETVKEGMRIQLEQTTRGSILE